MHDLHSNWSNSSSIEGGTSAFYLYPPPADRAKLALPITTRLSRWWSEPNLVHKMLGLCFCSKSKEGVAKLFSDMNKRSASL